MYLHRQKSQAVWYWQLTELFQYSICVVFENIVGYCLDTHIHTHFLFSRTNLTPQWWARLATLLFITIDSYPGLLARSLGGVQ